MLGRAGRIDDGAEVDAGRAEPRPHPCARVVLAETGVQRDVDTEACEVQRLAGPCPADRLVMPPWMDGRRSSVRQPIDVDHAIPGGAAEDRDLHQVARAGTGAGSGTRPWSRSPPTATAITSVTSITALNE